MNSSSKVGAVFALGSFGSLVVTGAAWAQALFMGPPVASFPSEQLTRGQAGYAQACRTCHGDTLSGGPFQPPLKGATFQSHWRGRSRVALSDHIRTTMPPGKLDLLSAEGYADVEAYVLQANDVPAEPSGIAANGAAAGSPHADPLYAEALKARTNTLASISDVSDRELIDPNPDDWIMWRRTYETTGFSPLKQINRSNVARLREAWSWALPSSTNEITPLVHDGVLFVYSGASVAALDAATGEALWHYLRPLPPGLGFGASQGKSLAIHGDKLLATTADGHMIALAVRTGAVLWDQEVVPSHPSSGFSLNSAPIVVKGTVIVGVSLGLMSPGGCFVVGLDVETGKERWRFNTIARPGQPGGDSWNGAPVEQRFGGGVWTGVSYDPDLDLMYFGVGNTYDTATLLEPRPDASGVGPNEGLYTDTTIALHPRTGALAWYYQHQKRDVWDLDWVFERTLATLNIAGRARKLVITGGKTALFDALDAATGTYVFSQDLGLQNLVTAIDPLSGDKTVNPDVQPQAGKSKFLCPHAVGARNWLSTALNPQSHVLFIPTLEGCTDYTYAPRKAALTAAGGADMQFSARSPLNHDGKFGRLVALDLQSRKVLWTYRQRAPFASATLSTAGDLLFVADIDRHFYAFDQGSGKILWSTRLSAPPESFPITYAVRGQQYVAIVIGNSAMYGSASHAFVPEVAIPAQQLTLAVFRLR